MLGYFHGKNNKQKFKYNKYNKNTSYYTIFFTLAYDTNSKTFSGKITL